MIWALLLLKSNTVCELGTSTLSLVGPVYNFGVG